MGLKKHGQQRTGWGRFAGPGTEYENYGEESMPSIKFPAASRYGCKLPTGKNDPAAQPSEVTVYFRVNHAGH